MRAWLLAALFVVVASCGGSSMATDQPDLLPSCGQPCTCAADSSCVMLPGFSSFCALDCTDDRDCSGEEQCVSLLRGTSTFLGKTCVKAARFLVCTAPTSCDLGTTKSCDGDTLVSAVTLTQGVCGRAYQFCANGCSGNACQ